MKSKKITMPLAVLLFVSALALPLRAYAGGADTTPPKLEASLEGGRLHVTGSDEGSGVKAVYVDGTRINSLTDGSGDVLLKDYAGNGKTVSIYAEDNAGNRSETVKLENPYYEETEATAAKTSQSAGQSVTAVPLSTGSEGTKNGSASSGGGTSGSNAQTNESDAGEDRGGASVSSIPEGAFTPEGTGTVQDEASSGEDDKQFYTITTADGNVFYLVIDGKRDANNVYFLNGVTEEDLMSLAEKSNGSVSVIPEEEACTCTEKCEAGSVNTDCMVCKNDLEGCTGKETEPEEPVKTEEPEPEEENSSLGMILLFAVAMLAAVGIGYYVKVIRPKQMAEEEEEYEDDGYGEGFDPDEAYGETEYLTEDDFDDGEEGGR